MFIICAGPDTYRAREKARELEAGFCKKYDPDGRAVERLAILKPEHVHERLYPLLSGGSLFCEKKFIRADGCYGALKAADRKTFASRVSPTGSSTIIVSVEEDAPSKKAESAFTEGALLVYAYPEMRGATFASWVRAEARKLGVHVSAADHVASQADGDSWWAISELMKFAANPSCDSVKGISSDTEENIFGISDAVMSGDRDWRTRLAQFGDEQIVTTYLSQLRSFTRIRDGHPQGIHPFIQKKLGKKKVKNLTQKYLRALHAFVSRRKGLLEGREYETLL